MPSQKNVEYIDKLKERLKDGKAFYFTDFTGLAVKNMEILRRELRKNNATYVILKNTLGYLAMKDMGFEDSSIQELFTGPTGLAVTFDDPVSLAKILSNTENLKLKGGFVEGEFLDKTKIIAYAKIPPKEVLYSQLLGSMNVISDFVYVLESIVRNLMFTLEAIKDKNKEAK